MVVWAVRIGLLDDGPALVAVSGTTPAVPALRLVVVN